MNTFYHGDCKFVMEHDIEPESIDLIYLDPPFFTGKIQKGTRWRPDAMEISFDDRKAYWGKHQEEMRANAPMWLNYIPGTDEFKAYLYYIMERLSLCHKVLQRTGSLYLHCDWRASHYLKIVLDGIFGHSNFRNEVVWHYISAPESKQTFGRKHDSLLFYAKSQDAKLNVDSIRVPHSIHTASKRIYRHGNKDYVCRTNPLGKALDDVWDLSIIPATSEERTGYPTQKPIALLKRIIIASSNDGDIVLDPFCGCGTAIVAAHLLRRQWIGIDINTAAKTTIETNARQAMFQGWADSFAQARYVSRDYHEVQGLTPHEFENWVNEYFKAHKPHPEGMVDGITKTGIPIQTKAYQKPIDYDIIEGFSANIRHHHAILPSITEGIIVSRSGFTQKARATTALIKERDHLEIKLLDLEDLLPVTP